MSVREHAARGRIRAGLLMAIGALAAGLMWAPLHTPAEAAEAAKSAEIVAPRVTVARADSREVVETVVVTGTLVPREEVLAGAEIDGLRILEIFADVGDTVKKDQVLVRLSRETLDAKVAQSDAAIARSDAGIAQAKSQIVAAEVTLKFASSDLDRAQKLILRGVSTQAIIDQKTSAANTAKAQLQVAKDSLVAAYADKQNLLAQRKELMIQVGRSLIKAPAAGLIAKRNAKVGAMVAAAGQPLFNIIKDGKIELSGEVTEQRLLSLMKGQEAKVTLANGRVLAGKVRLVSPQIDPVSRLGEVRVSLAHNGMARAGAFANARIEIRRAKSVTVPASAILYENNKTRVQIADGAVVRARPVKLGLVSGGIAEILEGVKTGERVVLRAGAFLRDGDAISPVDQKKETN